jgi:hypothetical protein
MNALQPYKLDDGVVRFIQEMNDPFVAGVQDSLATFAKVTMRDATTKQLALLFISDESFEKLAARLAEPEKINRLTISHVVRTTEAFRASSILRTNEHLRSSVWNINCCQLVAAAPNVRALAEISVQKLEAANQVFHYLKEMNWSRFKESIILLSGESGEGSLNDYVEKLFFGARRAEHVFSERLQQTNIMTILQRMNKKLKAAAGYDFLEKYEYVCELVHPNRAGFEIYVGEAERVDGYWERYPIAVTSVTGRTAEVLKHLLWLLAFSAGTMVSVQSVYNEINMLVREKIGFLYPRT